MSKKLIYLISFVLLLGLVNSASADINWTGPGTSWNDTSNWSPAVVPGCPNTAYISPPPAVPGPIIVASDVVCVWRIHGPRYNSDSDQAMSITGGNIEIVDHWQWAYSGNGTAIINISGDPTISIGSRWRGVQDGTGIINITGSPDITVGDVWRVADEDGTQAEINVSGGTITTGGYFMLGDDGSGFITISGGSIDIGGDWRMVCRSAAEITMTMSGGSIACAGDMRVPVVGDDGTCTVYMTGGTIDIAGHLEIGGPDTSTGHVLLCGGVIHTNTFGMRTNGGTGTMEICCPDSGVLIINGNVVAQIEGYVANGWIYCDDPTCCVQAVWDSGLNVTRVTCVPASCEKARDPSPVDGEKCVEPNVVLSWTPACDADSHHVYFGTDCDAVENATIGSPEFKGNQGSNSYDPGGLEECTTYCWRIDEACTGGLLTKGDVWSFTTCCPDPGIKWEQWPDETPTGMDIRIDHWSDIFPAIADDFLCTQPGLITDVHFWGSWKGDVKGDITKIHLSIHKDIPADPCDPDSFSKPGDLLWEMDFYPGEFTETLYADLSPEYEWWWYPGTGELDPNGDSQIWQYDMYIDPNEAFVQEGTSDCPEVYWLDIYVETDLAGEYQFGWKTSKKHWNDDAVYWAVPGVGMPPPFELRYPAGHPYAGMSIDMAFMITTKIIVDPNEACCFPDGSCQDLTPAECIDNNGTPQGEDTDCGDVNCPVPPLPTEACCLWDGNCADLTLAECRALGGTPQGAGTDCTDVNCPLCDIPPVNCPSGDPAVVLTYLAGLTDNFAPPPEPASPDSLLRTYIEKCSPAQHAALNFDEVPGEGGVPANSWLGHTFTCLPAGIIAARLEIRARATTGSGSGGTYNDHISIVNLIAGCAPTWAWQNRFENLPEAGGTWDPNQVATFCLDLDALPTGGGPVSVLDQLNSGSLSIRIDDDTGVDYMTLTIAVCPCEYRYPVEVLAGEDDDCNFTPPTEQAFPSTELATAFPGSWRKFDQIVSNRRFGHTFTGLQCCPVAAELEICMRAGPDIPTNDGLSLEYIGPSFAWGKRIKDLPLTPGGTPFGPWTNGRKGTFILDLGNLPPSTGGVTSVLGDMGDGDLDVYIQDDTAVDYMILRYWCCCEKTVPGDINIDWTVNFYDVAILADHWLEDIMADGP